MIEIKNLKKRFQTKLAVDGISFRIADGEIFGLLGPNGAGKTTTMRMLSTLLAPTAGQILMNGMDTKKKEREIKRKIAFLTNEIRLDGQFTPNELAEFYGSLYNLNKTKMLETKERLFDYFGITQIAGRRYETFSTGMKQKTSIAVCMIHDPEIIIFDEPTNGLDILTQKQVEDFLKSEREKGKTIIISTHILSVVEKLADRVGVIIDGKKAAEGTIEEVIAQTGEKNLEEAFLRLYKQNHREEEPLIKQARSKKERLLKEGRG